MATWLPLPGAVPQYCARYVDEAMGFAVGWNNWYSNALTLCAEISAAAVVIGFWNDSITTAAWITIIWVLVVCLNIFAVAIYGEAEFIFASIKLITIVGLLILALVIDLGGAPGQDRLGFRYWVRFQQSCSHSNSMLTVTTGTPVCCYEGISRPWKCRPLSRSLEYLDKCRILVWWSRDGSSRCRRGRGSAKKHSKGCSTSILAYLILLRTGKFGYWPYCTCERPSSDPSWSRSCRVALGHCHCSRRDPCAA